MNPPSPASRFLASTVSWLCLGCLLTGPVWAEDALSDDEDGVEIVGPMLPSTLPRDATLELPEWQREDILEVDRNQMPTNLGGGLWPMELWPLMPETRRLLSSQKDEAAVNTLTLDKFAPKEPLPAGLHEVYFGAMPPEAILDPQGFIDEMQQEEIGDFFAEFARKQAGVDVRVLVFGPTQELPADQALQELTDRWYPENQGIVVFYAMGLPKQSACCFSKALSSTFSTGQFTAVREACVKEALLAQNANDQLARYCIKMAVRMNRLKIEGPDVSQSHGRTPSTASPTDGPQVWAAGLAALILAGWGTVRIRRRSAAREPMTWTLPDQEITARLNAPHCGGTMAILKIQPLHTSKCVEIAVAPS